MNRILRSISLVLLCWALFPACTPSPSDDARLVIDESLLLDADQHDRVALFHGLLLKDYDIDYRVVTSGETGDIDQYAVSRFADLGAGDSSGTERGLLLVIDPVQDQVRLEVGYALEGTYPDAFIAYVEQRQMVPFFKAGRVADGILATTELIVTRAQAATANAGLDSEIRLEGSGGAGATTAARLGAGQDRVYTDDKVGAGGSPAETLQKYFAAMQQRNANPELDIYTPDTRRVLKDWVMTPAQMDNIVNSYRRCHAETERYDSTRRYAVIRYPIAERLCSPWFFENINGEWALDLTMMQRAIRFGRDNSWHFERGAEHPYRFAFADWAFDSMGFPREQ
jgi:uncharacterized protein